MFSVVNLVADRIPEKNITCTVFWGPQFAGLQVLALILQMNIHVGKRRKIKPFENIFLHAMPHYTYFNHFNNHLTPVSDQDRISPYNINTVLSRWVMRIVTNINLRVISESNMINFSKLTSQELYGWQ